MTNREILILVPARYQSFRFLGKPLTNIAGKSLIHRVWNNLDEKEVDVCIVTDDERIEKHVLSFKGRVCRIDDNVSTGTERVHLCYKKYFQDSKKQFIVNVQGDEPFIKGRDVVRLASFHEKNTFDITTFVRAEKSCKDFNNSNRVKVAYTAENHKCHYFSRSPIPFSGEKSWFLHIGIYCFTPESLQHMSQTKESPLEKTERLEQLRALEEGMSVGALITKTPSGSVDSPEDIPVIERMILDKS